MWEIEPVSDAIEHASPVLAGRIRCWTGAEVPDERAARRAALSVVRYTARLTGRPTPNGLFAGVVPARFASRPRLRWGGAHRAVARAESGWMAAVIDGLERQPVILERLAVVANTTLTERGGRLVVPYRPWPTDRGTGAVEVVLRRTGPVRAAVDAAREPILFEDLRAKLAAEFPHASTDTLNNLLSTLVDHRVLITGLHAPGNEPDALEHVLQELEAVGEAAAAQSTVLTRIHERLQQHRRGSVDVRRKVRGEAARQMRDLAPSRRHPVTVDLRLDADVALPSVVAREAERIALLLARLTPKSGGSTVWADYHRRFYQRFGPGVQVPLLEVVADSGIGWPDGYPGASRSPVGPRRTSRDEKLLTVAQEAALDGRREVLLDEALIAELEEPATRPMTLPAHLELCARIDSPSLDALGSGEFRLVVTSVSRSAGVVIGRSLPLLDEHEQEMLTAPLVGATRERVLPAQLSFPPLDPTSAHVTRTVDVLPTVISLAEHRTTEKATDVVTPADLAVACDSEGLYLTAPSRGVRVEPWAMHALNLRKHTPPLARFLIELTLAGRTRVTDFDWGAAAALPFLPRLRSGRVVVSAARWRMAAADLPDQAADWTTWDAALSEWRARRRLPTRVLLVDGDWRLPLDLEGDAHRALLREHLAANPYAVLEEAPASEAAGWFDGRAHEIVVTLAARNPHSPAPKFRRVPGRVVAPREHGLLPGLSPLLFAKLYGDPQRQDVVLAEHVPALLAEWGDDQPRWWFLRFREDGEHFLRLRIALSGSEPAVFGEAAGRVSAWVARLRRLGLLREVAFGTSFPEIGRWGCGEALAAAEAVFTEDSRVVLAQLARPTHLHRHVLAAVNFAAIAVAFTGHVRTGAQWLIDHVPARAPAVVPRSVFTQAQRLADPAQDFQALCDTTTAAPWEARDRALTEYRSHLDGVDPDTALDSLLHAHFLRACGIDADEKAVCLYLARVAALAFTAREGRPR
ncbi:lantibiotic dehydratase [Thermomonospora umbrina]|uniref:Thiopeptide-type bacteriocin biosynthesis protein n=1 Tax=Thermomonospora umbrina TaxID=111806 RepID=A0A3D9SSP4_9ACTN|nr:lantibiotic dehydratase [Thermomonospora umbrina]REE98996.1 thiopeptide-type bacteriocin biosynthesis protein [Thermomonospora umbrina]